MLEIIISLAVSVLFGTTTDTIELLRDILRKDSKPKEKDVIENIDEVKKKLEESQLIISKAISDIEIQKEEFESLKREAEISQNVAQLTEEQRNAVEAMLNGVLDDNTKKSWWINIGINFFFCVLGAFLGFFLGKFLG